MTDARARLLTLAAEQHGAFTTAQVVTAGLTHADLRQWQRAGVVARVDRGVWVVRGAPATPEQRAMSAVLRHGHGAALALHSAAWLWEAPGHRLDPLVVARRRDEHLPPAARSRTSRLLTAVDVTVRSRIPVTTPVRTVFDLAGRQHRERTRRDLNHLMGRGLIRLEQLDEALERLATRGRAGIVVMRELIAEVHEKGAPAGSNLELVVEDILETAGFRHMERQVPIYDEDGLVARVDFGDRRRRLAVEVDSDRFHGGLLDRQLDATKTARLERIGWTVVRITEEAVWWQRPELITRLRRLLWTNPPLTAGDPAA